LERNNLFETQYPTTISSHSRICNIFQAAHCETSDFIQPIVDPFISPSYARDRLSKDIQNRFVSPHAALTGRRGTRDTLYI